MYVKYLELNQSLRNANPKKLKKIRNSKYRQHISCLYIKKMKVKNLSQWRKVHVNRTFNEGRMFRTLVPIHCVLI